MLSDKRPTNARPRSSFLVGPCVCRAICDLRRASGRHTFLGAGISSACCKNKAVLHAEITGLLASAGGLARHCKIGSPSGNLQPFVAELWAAAIRAHFASIPIIFGQIARDRRWSLVVKSSPRIDKFLRNLTTRVVVCSFYTAPPQGFAFVLRKNYAALAGWDPTTAARQIMCTSAGILIILMAEASSPVKQNRAASCEIHNASRNCERLTSSARYCPSD